MSSTPASTSPGLTARQQAHTMAASFLGWTLDAFDFFAVVFLVQRLADHFVVSKGAIVWTITATLAMRPLGAVLFGMLADRYGRRIPLMANVIFFSVVELLCGFAPNYLSFLLLRILFGIGMGGEWGVGASMAMEAAPPRWRGVLSGVLQSGYSMGYLLAAVAARFILPNFGVNGWRMMFWAGGAPALLAFYIRRHVPESAAWLQHRAQSLGEIWRAVGRFGRQFAGLVLLMTLMMCLSHGTQDLYPDFLKSVHHFSDSTVSYMAMFYNVGAILGAICFGHLSQRFGRRHSMLLALGVSLLVIPLWAFGSRLGVLVCGSFLMQVGVQGAWGIIPAHLNELAPDAVRGLLPGLAYQLGILFAAPTNTVEYLLRDHIGYARAMAVFEICTILCAAVVI
ncbi:MAG: MFS transporter, partial [Terriglobales bacterium]